MTYDNSFFPNGIEDLPPSGINAVSRSRITGYAPSEPHVIDTGTEQLESPTVKDIMAQREDNPFLRLGVIGGVMGIVCLFLWGIFAFLSPESPDGSGRRSRGRSNGRSRTRLSGSVGI